MRLFVLVLLTACGRVGFDETPLVDDAADDSSVSDAACVLGPWSAPQDIVELSSTEDEFDATLSRDGLTIYFSSIRGGPRDIWTSTRASIGATWAAPTKVPELSTGSEEEGNPELSADGLEMYFGLGLVFRMTRPTTADTFANQQTITPNTAEYTGGVGAQLSSDGLELYFAALAPAVSAQKQMHRMRRSSLTSPWGVAAVLPVTDSVRQNSFMAISPDGLELVFSRNQGGPSWDMFRLTRASTSAEFDVDTEEAVPFNTGSSEADPEISFTGREMILNSDRPGGIGGFDLYVTTRACL